MKKAIGIILSVVCLLATATSILGIITANQGRVESISPDQLSELYAISEMPFPDGPEDGAASETEHPRSDTFVQLVKKMTDTTLTGRMRVLEGLTKKYESMEAELVKGGMKEGSEELKEKIEADFVKDVTSYGLYSASVHLGEILHVLDHLAFRDADLRLPGPGPRPGDPVLRNRQERSGLTHITQIIQT